MAQVSEWAAGGRRKRSQWKLLAGALVAVAAIGYLIASGIRGAAVYSLTISELKARGPAAVGQGARVSGTLDGSSVSWDASALDLRFTLSDGDERLTVRYRGAKPDMFNDGAETIVEGKLLADGTFEAKTLQLKCPSKYESGTPVYATPPNGGR